MHFTFQFLQFAQLHNQRNQGVSHFIALTFNSMTQYNLSVLLEQITVVSLFCVKVAHCSMLLLVFGQKT